MKFAGVPTILGVRAQAVTKGFKKGFVFVAIAGILGTGCGKKQNQEFDGIACGAADQFGSYMNPMDSTVIQTITLDANFSATQVSKIESAVQTWNAYGRRTIGHDLFRTQQAQLSANSVPEPSDDCSFPGSSGAFSVVLMNDQATWLALGFSKANPGVTLRCSTGTDYTRKQVVLLNPANMDGSQVMFESVILHELGHAIGLDHSCVANSNGTSNYVGCDSPSVSLDYKEAVMFPFVSADPGKQKEDLRSNDQERATCALNYRP